MPTAFEYRAAARRMRDAADEAGEVSRALWRTGDEHGVRGGRLETVVDTAFVAGALNAASLRDECEALADECERRAEVCEQFADDLARWRTAHSSWTSRHRAWLLSRIDDPDSPLPWPGREPREPSKPHDWVEIG